MRVALLGFGLIGGSIARALRASRGAGGWSIAAWSPTGEGPRAAAREDVIDRAARDALDAIAGADLVVLAAPALETLALLDQLAGPWADALGAEATVTDVTSTKGAIVAHAERLGLPFVGGHPMAGRETAGYGAATADLFVDRPWVITPTRATEPHAIALVETLAEATRALPLHMDPATHDAAVAGVSHLPLVLSAALVEAVAGRGDDDGPDRTAAAALAASGWRDMTRLARGDVAMGVGIAATNAPAIAARIRDVQRILDAWLADLDGPGGPDVEALTARLETVRRRLDP